MIARLRGPIVASRPDEVVLDVAGVGYHVHIPLSTFYRLSAAPGEVALHVHTHVREDAIQLFGFWTAEEKATFLRLIAVSGIGPKIALAVLSGIGVDDLERAIAEGDRAVLERIPGIGRKTAERVLLELKDRPAARRPRAGAMPQAAHPGDGPGVGADADAINALIHLGYSEHDAAAAVTRARRDVGGAAPIEDLLRASLKSLVR